MPRYIAEQADSNGQPMLGGSPVTGASIGPIPQGLRPRYATVLNIKTGKSRRVTIFSERAPLCTGPRQREWTLELREKDGTIGQYKIHNTTPEGHQSSIYGISKHYTGWRYTTDQGYAYACRIAIAITAQFDSSGKPLVGGQEMGGVIGFPPGLKPRSVTVFCAENAKTRQMTVFAKDTPL